MSGTWNCTVSELLDIFRDSLVAVLPSVERAHIPWREGDEYDEWDEITQMLFRHIVVGTIEAALPEGQRREMPKYDFSYESYRDRNVILAGSVEDGHLHGVFHSFSTASPPFGLVRVQPVDEHFCALTPDLASLPYQAVEFNLGLVRAGAVLQHEGLVVPI